MRLTKLGHACVSLEKDGATLVIDPGTWSGPGVLNGAQAVLVTHEHPDHLDAAAVRAALTDDPALELWSNPSVTAQFADFGSRVHEVAEGDVITPAGFDVHVYGRDHAQIMPEVPIIANTGFAVEGLVFHPGDSFTVPQEPVATLLLPVSAPWLKFAEVASYAREVAPARGGIAIHDAIVSPEGIGLISRLLTMVGGGDGAQFVRLDPGTVVDLRA
jgi:L-ascorbate metabolism protein UlaG (beta-lactamase superfamily)